MGGIMPEVKEVRCINCNKKLAEVTLPNQIMVASTATISNGMTVKCPRCSVITAISYGYLTNTAT